MAEILISPSRFPPNSSTVLSHIPGHLQNLPSDGTSSFSIARWFPNAVNVGFG